MCSSNENIKAIRQHLHIKSPLVENLSCSEYSDGRPVYLKLDNNQPGSSFKIRGIGRSCQLAKEQGYEEIVCVSGGNAGVASAYAARMLNLKAIIVIFKITSDEIATRIEQEGAQVVRYGNKSDESIDYAKYLASDKTKRRKFIHPFDDPAVWEGNSSLIDEIYQDLSGVQPSLIVTCCGGGGLFCGIMKGLERYNWHSTGVLVMETTGSGSFHAMTKNDFKPIEIVCDTRAKTLTSVIVCPEAANYASNPRFNVYSELVTDLEAMEACLLIADHQRIMIELSCGTVLSALYKGLVSQILISHPNLPDGPLVLIVCGGNDVKLQDMNEWKKLVDEAKGLTS